MPCCGQKRNTLKTNTSLSASRDAVSRHWPTPRPAPIQAPVPARAAAFSGAFAIAVEYTERSAIVVEGSFTHRRYEFSAAEPVQMVDSSDAPALLSTRFFVRR
jgi:hypothetical protein